MLFSVGVPFAFMLLPGVLPRAIGSLPLRGALGWLRFVHECRPSGAESSQPRVTPWAMWFGKPSPCKGKSTSPFAFSCAPFRVHWFYSSFAFTPGVLSFVVIMLLCLLERYNIFFACKDSDFLLKLVKEPSFFLRKSLILFFLFKF